MDRRTLRGHFALAQGNVEVGKRRIVKQRALIDHIRTFGGNVPACVTDLEQLEEAQVTRVVDRDRLLGELAKLGQRESPRSGVSR